MVITSNDDDSITEFHILHIFLFYALLDDYLHKILCKFKNTVNLNVLLVETFPQKPHFLSI